MADAIIAKVLKYDPAVDAEPHYETYTVDWVEDESGIMSALQVLVAINDKESQVAFDYCCHSSLCGRCSMMIDGKPALACVTPLTPGEHTFEPLSGLPVVKDLVVEKSAPYERIVGVDVTVKTKEPISQFKDIDYDLYWNVLEKLNMCRECMCCYSVCPAVAAGWNGYVGPAAMGAIAQRYYDTVDESDRLAQAVYSGLFNCIQCGACQAACPGGIPLTELFGAMQKDAEERGLKPESGLRRF